MRLSRRYFLFGAAAARLYGQKKKKKKSKKRRKQEQRIAAMKPPHVLVILTEDLGAWLCGCYGNQEIRTPNIDLLARLGVRYTNAFVVTPASSASRATLFTGRTPMQHGIHDFLTPRPAADPPQGQAAPPQWFADEEMLSDLLAARGFRCGFVGKWDMGNDASPGHAFEFTYTMPAPDMPYRNPTMSRNGKMENRNGYLPDIITEAAAEFLDGHEGTDPFLLVVSYPNPHEPYEGHPEQFYEMYRDVRFESLGWQPLAANALRGKEYMEDPVASMRKFAAAVSAVDAQVKTLIDHLRRTKLWSDTLVVFTSVTGHLLGRHGLWGTGLASDPPNMFDEVMRVPLIFSWPGEIPVESVRPEMVSFCDVLPTIAQVCRTAASPERNVPGRSFLYQFSRRALPPEEPWRTTVFGYYRDTRMARDNRFKLIVRYDGEGPNELYNLRRDPREFQNQYENPQYVTVRDRLRGRLDEWTERYSK